MCPDLLRAFATSTSMAPQRSTTVCVASGMDDGAFGSRVRVPLLARAWQLRNTVRGWDAMYIALAEALDAVLVTTDPRLARATGPTCLIEVLGRQ